MGKIELLNEPVFWTGTLEELKIQEFEGKQKITFKCEECNKPHTVSFYYAKKMKNFICNSCQRRRGTYLERSKKTCEERYGVSNYSSTEEGKRRQREINQKKYGVDYYFLTDDWKEKSVKTSKERYGVDNPAQAHYPQEVRNILFNKENFINFIEEHENKNTYKLSKELGIGNTTFRRYIDKYDLKHLYNWQGPGSQEELELQNFLKDLNLEFLKHSREIIPPYELDIFLPQKKIAIEFNGNYWHSTLKKPVDYHKIKSELCEEKGIRLIHIFEYEWFINKESLKSYLKNIFCRKIRPNLKNSFIKQISENEAKTFIQLNGVFNCNSSLNLGLFNSNNEILGVMSFSKNNLKDSYRLNNLAVKACYLPDLIYKNLLSYFENTYHPSEIITYCDRSKFTKSLYENLGFSLKEILPPKYVWVDQNKRVVDETYINALLKKNVQNLPEDEFMYTLNFKRIYDAGWFLFKKEYN